MIFTSMQVNFCSLRNSKLKVLRRLEKRKRNGRSVLYFKASYRAPHLNIYRVEFWVAKMTQWHLYRLFYDVSTILRSYILKVQPTQPKLKRTAPILKIQLTNKHQPNSPKFKPNLKIGSAVKNKDPSINIVNPCHKTPT